jgi:ABC-type sugar transport system substrate-binding protein
MIMGEVTHEFPLWGVMGVEYGVMASCHEYVPAVYNTDPSLVYKANASQFYPTPVLPAVNWQKIKASCKV